MTREEAVQTIKGERWICCVEKYREALEMAIKALEQEPCEDAIRRDELLKAIDTWDKFGYTETGCFVREPGNDYVPYIHYDDVIKCIKGMPPVNPQPKTGHWIKAKPWMIDNTSYKWECSECEKSERFRHNYCPNCGCRMVDPQESEDKE